MEFIREAYSSGKVDSFFPVLVEPSGSANPPLTGSKIHSLYAGTDDEEVVLLSDRPASTRTTGIDLADSRAHSGVLKKMHICPIVIWFQVVISMSSGAQDPILVL